MELTQQAYDEILQLCIDNDLITDNEIKVLDIEKLIKDEVNVGNKNFGEYDFSTNEISAAFFTILYNNNINVLEYLNTNTIPAYLFYTAELKHIEIPNGFKNIGNYAFAYAFIESIKLPNTLNYISNSAFEYCVALKTIDIPDSVIRVGSYAFKDCSELKKIKLTNVRTINNHTFKDCLNLKEIELSDKLESIEDHAFEGCIQLESIFIPASCFEIGNSVFEKCSNLTIYCEYSEEEANEILGTQWHGRCNVVYNAKRP